MQKNGVISVVVPVYNAEKTLEPCVNSILSQDYEALEIFLVDDGSKDGSLELCRKFANRDNRIRVIAQENAGVAMARNAALEKITGDYVLFVDSDDFLSPGACRQLVNTLGDGQLAIGHYYLEIGKTISDRGILSGSPMMDEKAFMAALMKQPGSFYYSALWNKLYLASIIQERCLRFDPFLHWGEDFAFNMQYFHSVKKATATDMPVYHYVKKPGTTSLRALTRIFHSCHIKWRLFCHFRALCKKKGVYAGHRWLVWRYIFNITLIN